MNKIIFDELQWNEAQKQLNIFTEELEDIYFIMQETKHTLSEFSEQYQYQEELRRCEQLLRDIKVQIQSLERKMQKICICYKETEMKNMRLVEQVAASCRYAGKNYAIFDYVNSGKVIRIREAFTSRNIQHESWLMQALMD